MKINTISFPNLFERSFEINRVAFTIFGLDIYWYGIMILCGALLALFYGLKRAKSFGVIPDKLFDTVFISAIIGIIGARIYFVVFHNLNPNNAFHYDLRETILGWRDGGLAIYGGLIFGVVTAIIYTRVKKLRILPILDLAGMGFLIGQGIGRWGNFFNQEAYGSPTTGLKFGMTGSIIERNPIVAEFQATLPAGEIALVHPCFFYEFLWCALGFLLLHIWSKKWRTFDGEIFLLYCIWYGLGRFFIEGLRSDSLYMGSIKISQLVSACAFVIGLAALVYIKHKVKNNPDYTLAAKDEECIKAIENYSIDLKIEREQQLAVKALKKTEKEIKKHGEYKSVLGDDNDL